MRAIKESVALFALCGLLGACATTTAPVSSISLPTLTADAMRVQMTGAASGTLSHRDGCVRLNQTTGAGYLVVWPAGTQVDSSGAVILPGGRALRMGSSVRLGGGERADLPGEMVSSPAPVNCVGPYFIATSVDP